MFAEGAQRAHGSGNDQESRPRKRDQDAGKSLCRRHDSGASGPDDRSESSPWRRRLGGAPASALRVADPPRALSGCRGAFGGGLRHPVPNLRFSFGPEAPRPFPALSFELRNKVFVVQREDAELTFAQVMIRDESRDVGENICHNGPLMGEISPAVNHDWGIFRASRFGVAPCDKRVMRDIQEIRATILSRMKDKGLSRRKLSGMAGLSESAVRDFLTRTQSPGIATLQKLAAALEMPIEELTGESAGTADQWQPHADTVQLIVEVALLPFPQSRVNADDLPIFAHAVTEAVRYVSSDPARADKPGFRDAVEAIVETAVRSYRRPSEQAA